MAILDTPLISILTASNKMEALLARTPLAEHLLWEIVSPTRDTLAGQMLARTYSATLRVTSFSLTLDSQLTGEQESMEFRIQQDTVTQC